MIMMNGRAAINHSTQSDVQMEVQPGCFLRNTVGVALNPFLSLLSRGDNDVVNFDPSVILDCKSFLPSSSEDML